MIDSRNELAYVDLPYAEISCIHSENQSVANFFNNFASKLTAANYKFEIKIILHRFSGS